jgi:hypothetical protein
MSMVSTAYDTNLVSLHLGLLEPAQRVVVLVDMALQIPLVSHCT